MPVILHRINYDPTDKNVGLIFNSNKYGKCIILSKEGRTKRNIQLYRIHFIDTGYEMTTQLSNIRLGNVFDPLCPLSCGVGYLGFKNTDYSELDKDLYQSLKHRWLGMLSRCYNKNNKHYYDYGYLGVSVCDRWKNFSNYFMDVQKLKGFNHDEVLASTLELDKDFLQQGLNKSEMVYSKDTCIWLSDHDNGKLGKAQKRIRCIHPDKTVTIEESVQSCMKKYGLEPGSFYGVLNGKRHHVKGYIVSYYDK